MTSPPTNQKNVHELITPSSLNYYYKTPCYPLQVGTHSLEGISPLWPPLTGKAIKLFFSVSPKLCLRDLIRCRGTEAGFGFSKNIENTGTQMHKAAGEWSWTRKTEPLPSLPLPSPQHTQPHMPWRATALYVNGERPHWWVTYWGHCSILEDIAHF